MPINPSGRAFSGYRKRPPQSTQGEEANPRQRTRHLSREEEKVSRSRALLRESPFALNFRNQGLERLILPPDIRGHNSKLLKKLDLRDNQLTSLPGEIRTLRSLTHLLLSNNRLTSLPKEIGELRSLTHLSLDDNNLVTLPPQIGILTRLEVLSLKNNNLLSLPSTIGNLEALKDLALNNNQLRSFPRTIRYLNNPQDIHIENNPLTRLPEEVRKLRQLPTHGPGSNRSRAHPSCSSRLFAATLTKQEQGKPFRKKQRTICPKEIGILKELRFPVIESTSSHSQPSSNIFTAALTQQDNLFSNKQPTTRPREIGILTQLLFQRLKSTSSHAKPSSNICTDKLTQLQKSKNPLTICPKEIRILKKLRFPVIESTRS